MAKPSPLANPAPGSIQPISSDQSTETSTEEEYSKRRRRLTGLSVWLPAASVTAFAAVVLVYSGVSSLDIALFSAYITLGLTLPGILIIRSIRGQVDTLAEEVALGLALGCALEVFTYIGARAIGAPLLVLVWPIAAYTLFLAVPRMRRHWRRTARLKVPLWWSWSLAAIIAYLVVWSASYFKANALTWPGMAASNIDVPFHLSLIGELKHHMPPTVPMVSGEPLFYHWFLYAHFAATSWVTGVEPLVLLVRLGMLPMFAALFVLLGAIGRRVMNSWPAALVAVLGTVLVAVPNLYLGTRTSVIMLPPVQSWESPTETFGALLFAPVVLLLIDLLQHRLRTLGIWLLLGVFLVAVMGAKATHLPILVAGLGTVAAVEIVRRRRLRWATVAALGMTALCFLYATFVLFGNTRQGMMFAPLFLTRGEWGKLTGLFHTVEPSSASVLGVTLLYVASWCVLWLGVLGLLSRPRLLIRPIVLLMLGMGSAGLGAMLLLGHPHNSQSYFLQVSCPYLVILAVYGLTVTVRRTRLSPRAIMFSAVFGMVATYLIRMLCGVRIPLGVGQPESALYLPYIALLLVIVILPVVVMRLAKWGGLRACTVIIVVVMSAGVPAAWFTRVLSAMESDTPTFPVNFHGMARPVVTQAVPQGILAAGRWLRAHSDPNQLVATNSHCLWGYESPCDSRHAWVAALTERRVLVEGWMYTPTNNDRWRPGLRVDNLPFWDAERLQLNDAAFSRPSWNTLHQLRERYGVRWLFVDERRTGSNSYIGGIAKLRFHSGDYAIYQI